MATGYISVWPVVLPWATDLNIDPGYYRTMDPDMVPSTIPGLDVTMAPGVSTGHSDCKSQLIFSLFFPPELGDFLLCRMYDKRVF